MDISAFGGENCYDELEDIVELYPLNLSGYLFDNKNRYLRVPVLFIEQSLTPPGGADVSARRVVDVKRAQGTDTRVSRMLRSVPAEQYLLHLKFSTTGRRWFRENFQWEECCEDCALAGTVHSYIRGHEGMSRFRENGV
eukprot:4623347-Amphidinium_carterae.1